MSETKTVMMPRELTAENGAKDLLFGEFSEGGEQECLACDGAGVYTDTNSESCECQYCDGAGHIVYKVMVSWTTIKAIYERAVEHFGE